MGGNNEGTVDARTGTGIDATGRKRGQLRAMRTHLREGAKLLKNLPLLVELSGSFSQHSLLLTDHADVKATPAGNWLRHIAFGAQVLRMMVMPARVEQKSRP